MLDLFVDIIVQYRLIAYIDTSRASWFTYLAYCIYVNSVLH